MKTWKTVSLTAIATACLYTAGIQTYELFNEPTKEIEVTTTTSSTSKQAKQETKAQTKAGESTTYYEPVQDGSCLGGRVYQPTFRVVYVSPKYDLYAVEHIPTHGLTKAITKDKAEAFCKYMEQIANGKDKLTYSMQANYNTWLTNNAE